MNYHHKDIGEHIETTFRAVQERLREEHHQDLREAQFAARKTNNGAALLPAEAASYIRHTKALTIARAQAIADAYTAFREPSGDAGLKDLTHYYNTALAARRSAFQGHATQVAQRTGRDLGQLPGLLHSFERDAGIALLDGKSILAKQTVAARNQSTPPPAITKRAALNPAQAVAATKALLTRETLILGKLLWMLLRSEALMSELRMRRIPVNGAGKFKIQHAERTSFGEEVGRDEIEWWINRKETELRQFTEATENALRSAQCLKEAAEKLKKLDVETYDEIIEAVRMFAKSNFSDLAAVHNFAKWLYERDHLAPGILFTYKVWGSTRRGDRIIPLTPSAESPEEETPEVMQKVTEAAWGFLTAGLSRYVRAAYEVGADIYDSFLAAGKEPDEDIPLPEDRVARRAAREITDECAVFFEFLRNSLRDIESELIKRNEREARLTSDRFWRDFIAKARKSPKAEPTLWDFKETLSFWHAQTGDARRREKVKLAADVASFANAEGGCLIVGVSDDRRVVGVSANSRDLENRLTITHQAIEEHLAYPRNIYRLRQIPVIDDDGNEKLCFVIAIARACEPAAARDGDGNYFYPVRHGSGTVRGDKDKLQAARWHEKNDRFTFLDELEQFVADT